MMRLQICPVDLGNPRQASFPLITKYPIASVASVEDRKRNQSVVCQVVLSSPFKSRKFLKPLNFNKQESSRVHRIKRSCRANLDEDGFGEQQHIEALKAQGFGVHDNEEGKDYLINNQCCAINERAQDSFWQSHIELLDPTMLGIRPEPPDWPERDSVCWEDIEIEHKAKNFDLPLSLRMIKKKLQREQGFKRLGEASSPVTKAFSSMAFIIVELQSCALRMREALCNEDLEVIISGVQKDMYSSFAWLFQQVFSRTPDLMVSMMILLADFATYSTLQPALLGSLSETTEELGSIQHCQRDNYGVERGAELATEGANKDSSDLSIRKQLNANPEEILQVGNQEFRSAAEVSLWNSFLDQATKMQGFDRDVLQNFVSPFSVEIEPEDYMDYLRTSLMYQVALSQDPNNPLLLCNYALFLHLAAHDYDRAEECFKRAIQVEPPDAESLSRYADFLWTVRKDLWRAEDTYLQALSIEPENSYYASKYANFLWNTGGEETCFPLDASNNNSRNSNM
ncbi:hypothetical protein ACH5RR_019340 [Cinchona calisaya]|uniref:Tetratricopeptide repeat-like superfamily protein n=1 Tax=Cinchona calisaya TaxID=153742 RepID=A0ABD2ZP53_9GENT